MSADKWIEVEGKRLPLKRGTTPKMRVIRLNMTDEQAEQLTPEQWRAILAAEYERGTEKKS